MLRMQAIFYWSYNDTKFVFIPLAPEFVEHVYGCYLKLFGGKLVIFISLSSYKVLSYAFT